MHCCLSSQCLITVTVAPQNAQPSASGGKARGVAARYCEMGPQKRMAQYASGLFDVRPSPLTGHDCLWCAPCGKPVSHQSKTFVDSHIKSKSHKEAVGVWEKRRVKQEQSQPSSVAPAGLPDRVSTLPEGRF